MRSGMAIGVSCAHAQCRRTDRHECVTSKQHGRVSYASVPTVVRHVLPMYSDLSLPLLVLPISDMQWHSGEDCDWLEFTLPSG